MNLSSPAFRDIAACATLTCFAIGLFSAQGAHAVDTHLAVADARVAAHQLERNREELERTLAQAQGLAQEAATVADEDEVARAAQSLGRAMEAASVAVGADHTPLTPTTIVLDDVDTASAPVPEAGASTPTGPAASPVPEASAEPPPSDTEPAADPVIEQATDGATKVLSGEIETAREARAATERLVRANAVIDAAAEQVNAEAQALADATQKATLAANLAALPQSLASADQEGTRALELITAVGQRTTSSEASAHAFAAHAAQHNATARARTVERTDPDAVALVVADLDRARAALDDALVTLELAHVAWINEENSRRDALNGDRLDAYQERQDQAWSQHVEDNRAAVVARSNGWSGSPNGVSGSNGRLDSSSLCDIDFLPGARLQCDAAAALEDANRAYRTDVGQDLAVTDTYRGYGLQVTTRARKPSTAAVPGTSNHGWGMAIDLDVPSSAWMRANGADYGWVHPAWARPGGVRPESWHLEYVATSVGAFEPPEAPVLLEHAESVFDEADNDA